MGLCFLYPKRINFFKKEKYNSCFLELKYWLKGMKYTGWKTLYINFFLLIRKEETKKSYLFSQIKFPNYFLTNFFIGV